MRAVRPPRGTTGVLAGLPFVVVGLVLFIIDPVVRTAFAQLLGLAALIAAGATAGWSAAWFRLRRGAAMAGGALLSVLGGITVGCLTLLIIGAFYWLAAVVWFVRFSHFTW